MERLESRDLRSMQSRQRQHSVRLDRIARQIEDVKLENEALKELVLANSGQGTVGADHHKDRRGHYAEDYEKEVEGSIHDEEFERYPDGKVNRSPLYWGYNHFVTPKWATTKRYEDDLYSPKRIEEWKRRRQFEEELWMKDKPKTYEYTGPYQEYKPPRNINKYFHDSKYEEQEEQLYQEDDESSDETPSNRVPRKTNPFLTTTYEKTFISPRPKGGSPPCGGMYLMRYNKDGHQNATLAFKGLQTLINNSYRGCVMGMATDKSIFIIEGGDDWGFAKAEKTNPRIGFRHRLGEKAISALWFPDADQARGFFACGHRMNPFKEGGFPTSEGFEAIYTPMIKTPLFKTMDTFLIIEFLRAKALYKDRLTDLKAFQEEAQEEILKLAPYSSPMVSACLDGREAFKPGPFIRTGNQVYISRFHNQTEVATVWNSGKLQELRDKYGLHGPTNIVSFSIKDWSD